MVNSAFDKPFLGESGSGAGTRFTTAWLLLAVVSFATCSTGCTSLGRWAHQGFKVGPDYGQPPAAVADNWIDYENSDVVSGPTDFSRWWTVFGDPKLDELIETASRQNLTLQAAGMRILEARARLGIARGNLFPQFQQAYGDFARVGTSATNANVLAVQDFDRWDTGLDASWELDFWGRFRRAIEAEDALLNSEIENYDNVLVLLQAEVATAYIQYRTLQQRLEFAKQNVELQKRAAEIAEVRFRNDKDSELALAQAKENLSATESFIPEFESGLRQTGNALCVLLGIPPRDLAEKLGDGPIPAAPAEILVGVPADLLRRRPDVRQAERLAAAQSAAIGIAESDFYPRIAVTGFIGLESEDFAKLFDGKSLSGSIGPGFRWNILNYGRILNNVRAQEARFYKLVLDYQNTVLTANQEVEDGIIAFLKDRERVLSLGESATQGQRAVDISTTRYKLGKEPFLQVVYVQQQLTIRQDQLAVSRGDVAADLVSIYRALGGGWEARLHGDMPPALTGDEPLLEDVPPPEPADGGRPADPPALDIPPLPMPLQADE